MVAACVRWIVAGSLVVMLYLQIVVVSRGSLRLRVQRIWVQCGGARAFARVAVSRGRRVKVEHACAGAVGGWWFRGGADGVRVDGRLSCKALWEREVGTCADC